MKPIPIDLARELFELSPDGVFVYKVRPSMRTDIGKVAGTVNGNGYLMVSIEGRQYLAHRVAWALYYDQQPPTFIDHIDGDKLNNSQDNLRAASKSENGANCGKRSHNKSGFKGASLCRQTGRWRADITVEGKRKNLGRFDTPEAAHMAWLTASQEAFGQFARAA